MGHTLIFITAFAAIGGFLFGYDLGLIGGAMLQIQDVFHTSRLARAMIVGSAKMGAFFGTFLGGAAIHKYGRKATIALDSIFFTLGPLIMAFAPPRAVEVLIFGRLVVGVGIGVSAVAVPVYLAEIAPPLVRGTMVSTYELMLCVGMLAAVLVDSLIQEFDNSWRWMVGIPVVPGLSLMLALVLLPESPRWLVMCGDLEAAMNALHSIAHSEKLPVGCTSSSQVEEELLWLWSAVEQDRHAHCVQRAGGRGEGALLHPALSPPAKASCAGGPSALLAIELSELPTVASGCLMPEPSEALGIGGRPLGTTYDGFMKVSSVDPDHTPRWQDTASPRRSLSRGRSIDGDRLRLMPIVPSSSSSGPGGLGKDGSPKHEERTLISNTFLGEGAGWFAEAEAPDTAWKHGSQPARHEMHEGFVQTLQTMVADMCCIFRGSEKRAVHIAVMLAFLNQMMGSTAVINYAPTIFEELGAEELSTAYTGVITGVKMAGVVLGMFLVDMVGRRQLLLLGTAGCGLGMAGLAISYAFGSIEWSMLSMCVYILTYSMSWAGVFWVLCSELFSMSIKSPATSVALAVFFASGAIANVVCTYIYAITFVGFAIVAFGALLYVWVYVPETKGKTLFEVQTMLQTPSV